MANDRVKVTDGLDVEPDNVERKVEEAMYPCPNCGKGGVVASPIPCEACGGPTHAEDMICPKCGLRYDRNTVPVMVFVCRICHEPGESKTYILADSARVHEECANRTVN